MKRVMIVLAITATMGAAVVVEAHKGEKHTKAAAPAPAAAAAVTKVRLAGELVDPQCWFTHNGEGRKHADCAVTCARGGQNLAFLEKDTRDLYTLIAPGHGKNPNVGLYDHVGVPVHVRGTVYQRGTNRGLLLEGVERVR